MNSVMEFIFFMFVEFFYLVGVVVWARMPFRQQVRRRVDANWLFVNELKLL